MEPGQDAPGGARTAQRPEQVPDPLGLGPITTGPPPANGKKASAGFPIGTRRMTESGYITVKLEPETGRYEWISEGRAVMERHLERPLEDNEEVRHRPGVDTWDNRLDGLELWRDGRPRRIRRQYRRRAKKRTQWKQMWMAAAIAAAEAFPNGRPEEGAPITAEQAAVIGRLLDS